MSNRADISDSIYSFENQGRRKFEGKASEDAALAEFASRLKFSDADYSEHRDTLLNFILNHRKIICRYKDLRTREMKWRILFTGVSLMLLFAIPLLILAVGAWLSGDKGSIIAQLTGLLTGIVAVHKSLSSWLDKRKVIGNFWKAESDLKTKLYAFEDKWRGKATQDMKDSKTVLKNEFVNEARIAIAEARAIVKDEQSQFFDTVTYPSIDLGEMLKDSGDRAKTLVTTYVPPELEQRETQRQSAEAVKAKIIDQKDKIVRLEAEIEQRRQLVKKKREENAPKEEADAVQVDIKAQLSKIKQAEEDLVIAKSQLEALLYSRSV